MIAVLLMPGLSPVAAQEWNDARTMALVTRATARRARQLADTGLTDYMATALGSLTFLAQVGEGFPDPPRVVKADQIALEVYWRAPSYSKQLILGRRDTLLLPTDIQYHRDHLGIVQNNFPGIIRLGEGDEVRDVPHPLSAAGLQAYDYAIHDSLRIGIPGRVIDVLEVLLRPKDVSRPAAVGAVYLSREDAQVVRMAFSFTRAALIDPQLEDVAIVLDNALIEERFWLPRRQEIEIRRSGSWLDFPARGIIRGGWEICCYRINQGFAPVVFTGPEIQLAPPERRAAFEFDGPTRSIVPPDLATVTPEDVARVQAQARELVAGRALGASRRGALLAGSVSDLVRVNRVEGLSLGAGSRIRVGEGVQLAARVRFGLADQALRGGLQLSWSPRGSTRMDLLAFRELQEAGIVPEVSGVRNSIAAQEFGADYTAPYDARGVELRVEHGRGVPQAVTVSFGIALERTDSTPVAASPARGAFAQTLPVPRERAWRADVRVALAPRHLGGGVLDGWLAYQVRRRIDSAGVGMSGRATAAASWERPAGSGRLVLSSIGGVTNSPLPQDRMAAGGPVTGPGYAFHEVTGTMLLSQRLEWQVSVPFPSFSLGRWGRTPGEARLAPFGSVILRRAHEPDGHRHMDGFPGIGLGLIAFYDLLRIDVARGLRNGRWRFGVDVSRGLWRIL